MRSSLIESRLKRIKPTNEREEENALKEVFQEFILLALSRAGLFDEGSFMGGTALRILHGLERFSEDIDLALNIPDSTFRWTKYQDAILEFLAQVGVKVIVRDKSEVTEAAVRTMIIKDDSLAKFLELRPAHHKNKSVLVKLELDTNPPSGAIGETRFLNYPEPFSVVSHDLPSLFAGKCHALLCRPFVKGRDWYDFLWYARRGIVPSFTLLTNALNQAGPWKGSLPCVNAAWLQNALTEKISDLNWKIVAHDVAPFLPVRELAGLKTWSREFFASQVGFLSD